MPQHDAVTREQVRNAAEGGFINDRSGEKTQAERQRLGIVPPRREGRVMKHGRAEHLKPYQFQKGGRRNPDPSIFTKGTLRNLTHEGVDEDLTEQRLGKKDGSTEAFETNPLPSTGFVASGEPFAPGVKRHVGDPANRDEQEPVREPVAKAAGETFTPGTTKVVEKDTLEAGGFPEQKPGGKD